MSDKSHIPFPQDQTRPMARIDDGDGFFIPFSGGMRMNECADGLWFLEPVFDGEPTAKGPMSTQHMQALMAKYGLNPIAFLRVTWRTGAYTGSWSPITPGRTNHMIGPADVWSQISGHFFDARMSDYRRSARQMTRNELSIIYDNRTDVERLSKSISLSLRNMDITIEAIADFYHEQLTNLMYSKSLNGELVSTIQDQLLYAHIHAFFMHLGSARDYLATLIALRLKLDQKQNDAMSKLVSRLRVTHVKDDSILEILHGKGYIVRKDESGTKLQTAGWLADVTDLRNELMHRRSYGDRFIESRGFASVLDVQHGLYRYHRPMMRTDGSSTDALDIIISHYKEACSLFLKCAEASGYESSIPVITDNDIVPSGAT